MGGKSDKTREVTCRGLTDFLMDYLDGALPAERARRFQEHLDACPACSAYLRTYDETRRLIVEDRATEASPEMPEDLVQAILAARKP